MLLMYASMNSIVNDPSGINIRSFLFVFTIHSVCEAIFNTSMDDMRVKTEFEITVIPSTLRSLYRTVGEAIIISYFDILAVSPQTI